MVRHEPIFKNIYQSVREKIRNLVKLALQKSEKRAMQALRAILVPSLRAALKTWGASLNFKRGSAKVASPMCLKKTHFF